jgi:hypothetical protein
MHASAGIVEVNEEQLKYETNILKICDGKNDLLYLQIL